MYQRTYRGIVSVLLILLTFHFAAKSYSQNEDAESANPPPPATLAPPATPESPKDSLPPKLPDTPLSTTAPAPPPPPTVFYYCQQSRTYYPGVQECPGGWTPVPVSSLPPPTQQRKSASEIMETAKASPNEISLELLGKAIDYSVNYEHVISDHLTAGLGLSLWDTTRRWRGYENTVFVVPVFVSYYFQQSLLGAFVSAGIDIIHVSNPGVHDDSFANNGIAGILGGGYEFRGDGGFLVRLAGYLIAGRSTTVNPSFSIGFAF